MPAAAYCNPQSHQKAFSSRPRGGGPRAQLPLWRKAQLNSYMTASLAANTVHCTFNTMCFHPLQHRLQQPQDNTAPAAVTLSHSLLSHNPPCLLNHYGPHEHVTPPSCHTCRLSRSTWSSTSAGTHCASSCSACSSSGGCQSTHCCCARQHQAGSACRPLNPCSPTP